MAKNENIVIETRTRKRIVQTAGSLYLERYYHVSTYESRNFTIQLDEEFSKVVEGVIMDNGIQYLRDAVDWLEWWEGLVETHPENKETFQFNLISLAQNFRAMAFTSGEEYKDWIIELSRSISSMRHGGDGTELSISGDEKNPTYVCCDDSTFERMPLFEEIKVVLSSNPWVCYLITLSMGMNQIMQHKVRAQTISEIITGLKDNKRT